MNDIFSDCVCQIQNAAKTVACKIYNGKRSIKICCFLLISVICIAAGLASVGATVAYKVSIGGEVIATVRNKQQYASALDIVKQKVSGVDVERAVSEPKYSPTLALDSGIDSDEAVAVSIIETTDEIVSAKALVINGQTVAYTKDIDLNAILDERKNTFFNAQGDCVIGFVDDVRVEDVYCISDDISSDDGIVSVVASLNVVSETTVTNEV